MTPLIAGFGFVSTVVVVRVLAPDDFALYAIALALRGTLQWVSDMGMGAASSRVFAEMRGRGLRGQALGLYGRLLRVRAAIGGLLVALVVALPDETAHLLGLRSDEHFFLLAVVPIGVAEIAAGIGLYVLSGTFGQRWINRVVLAQGVIQTVLVLLAAAGGLGLPGILGGVVVGSLVKAFGLNLAAVRALRGLEDKGKPLTDLGVTYATVGGASALGKVSSWVHSRPAVTLLVAAAFGRHDVALFAVAYDLVHQALNFAAGPLYSLLLPLFAIRKESPAALARLLRRTTRALALIVVPVAAGLIATYPSLSRALYGPFYTASYPYAVIIAAGFALEIVLSGPATSLILVKQGLVRSYLSVKVLTLGAAALYLPLAVTSVLVVTAVMMSIRVLSAAVLHVIIDRSLHVRLDFEWVVRVVGAGALTTCLGIAAGAVSPGWVADLIVVPTVVTIGIFITIRMLRLFTGEDAELLTKVVPQTKRVIRWLKPE